MTKPKIDAALVEGVLEGKVCKACHTWKSFDAYYKHPNPTDKHFGRCKKCERHVQETFREMQRQKRRAAAHQADQQTGQDAAHKAA